jgi:hypothetical protein
VDGSSRRENPEGRTPDVPAGRNKLARQIEAKTVERLRKPEGGTQADGWNLRGKWTRFADGAMEDKNPRSEASAENFTGRAISLSSEGDRRRREDELRQETDVVTAVVSKTRRV